MHRKLWALLPLILFSLWAKADDDKTRGIGQYPGRQREAFIPQRTLPADYANQAWMRQAWASSSIDYNLTAQLATDGILTQEEPPRVRVTTSDGELSLRDREKTFDGNAVTSVYVMGDDAFIQYDWTGMAVATRFLRLNAWAAYREQQAMVAMRSSSRPPPTGRHGRRSVPCVVRISLARPRARRQPPTPTSRRLSSVCRCA